MNTPRIYVADLASYNNGILHGAWIDADQSADEIRCEIENKVLSTSKFPNVTNAAFHCKECGKKWARQIDYGMPSGCPDCDSTDIEHGSPYPSSEEWAIHDFEGFCGMKIEEYTSISEVSEIAEAVSEHGELYSLLRDNGMDHDESIKMIEENYQGEYDDLADYAYRFAEDMGDIENIPEPYRTHINWEGIGRDMKLGGDILTLKMENHNIAVFWNR